MKTHETKSSAEHVKHPDAGEGGARDSSGKRPAKHVPEKCETCAGTGEIREPGHYAVRCPVCLGSRLARQSENRQLDVFVSGPKPKVPPAEALKEVPAHVVEAADTRLHQQPAPTVVKSVKETVERPEKQLKDGGAANPMNAEDIRKVGAELYGEVVRFADNIGNVGKCLKSTVNAYNDAIPGLDRFIIAKSRKLRQLGAGKGPEPELPEVIDLEPKQFSSPELLASNLTIEPSEGKPRLPTQNRASSGQAAE